MLDELFIALSLVATSGNPALLPDIFTGKEAHGEYLFYAAADNAHGVDPNEPAKINANGLKVSFVVDFSFQEDTRRVALADIRDVKSRVAQGDKYDLYREQVEMDGPGSFLDAFETNVVFLPIESGENWGSWIYGAKHNANLPASLSIHYQVVEDERTLSITAYSISDDYTLEELLEHWQTLVDTYRDIPMQVFTGALVQ